jgi:4-hydroxy-2-oxoheptanedioate aldolase
VKTHASSSVQIAAWSMLGTPAAASLMSRIGADLLVLDAQHGLFDDAALIATVPAVSAVPVHVRVPDGSAAGIGRALDAGAAGVIVPMVQDATEAEAAASATRYPPLGERSWGPLAAYRGEPTTPPAEANARVSCAVMVETSRAIANLDGIASAPGVDMVFVGPFDLAIALGMDVPGLLGDRSDGNPLDAVVAACRRAGTRAGAFAGSLETAAALIARGFTTVAVAVDTQLITAAGRDLVDAARSIPVPPKENE